MTNRQHEQARAGMLCVIAFTIGTVLSFASGCTSGFQTKAHWHNYEQPSDMVLINHENR
mgnify:CR=1 FL=1